MALTAALLTLGDPPGDLLPVRLGQQPALHTHPVLLSARPTDHLHQDQLLPPVGIKVFTDLLTSSIATTG